MKARFLAFLGALAVGSAAVLIYASQAKPDASATLTGADDCGACEMSAATPAVAASVKASDGCCASEAAKPAVATLDTAGCPYDASATTTANAKIAPTTAIAALEAPKASGDACCASEGATSVTAAKVE